MQAPASHQPSSRQRPRAHFLSGVAASLLFCALSARAEGATTVRTYPAPEGVASDDAYDVKVNGKSIFVFKGPVAGLASFEFSGSAAIEITPKTDVLWADVRPLSRGIKPKIEGGKIHFTLTKPGNFSIEFNGEFKRHPLFLFANPIETDAPTAGTPGVHHFAAGKVHRPGLIEVKSGESVYIEGGAIVEGSILGKGVSGVKIRGRGIIDGTNLRTLLKDKLVDRMRPHMISLKDCRDVEIEGVILSNAPTWQLVPVNCEGLTISNIKIVSDNGGDDGIDIVRSRNVKITRSFFHTKDDNIVVKALQDYPKDVTSAHIDISDCVFWNTDWGNALEIGFELRSDRVFDVIYRDSDVIHVEDGAVFSIHNGDGAMVEDVTYRNIRVEDARQKLFDFAIFLSQYSVDRPVSKEVRDARYLHGVWDGVLSIPPEEMEMHASHRGHIRNVLLDNIQIVDGQLPFSVFVGFDAAHVIEGVVIRNLTVRGKPLRNASESKSVIRHARVRFK